MCVFYAILHDENRHVVCDACGCIGGDIMNAKKMKKIRKLVKPIQVEWVRSLLNEEEAEKVNLSNIDMMLSKQTHFIVKGTLYLSAMTDKWIVKYLKKYPNISCFQDMLNVPELKKKLELGW